MSIKLKVLGLGLLVVMATSAFAALNASASVTGHFTHDAATDHATISGTENGIHSAHSLQFQGTDETVNNGPAIVCNKATYSGTVAKKSVTSLSVTPSYSECKTTGTETLVTVTHNECTYAFSSNAAASTHTPTKHATVKVNCPVGKAIEIHHPSCTMTVPAQTLTKGGATYTTITEGNPAKHALTVNITITHIATEYHGGICIFLGTNHEADMNGSVTVKGVDTPGNPINITAT